MKFGLIVVAAILLSALAASFLLADPGYVVIQFHGYLVEMSVPALLGLLALLLCAAWLVVKTLRVPRKLGEAAGRYRSGRAGQKLTRGMIEIAEGNFSRGEKLLARAAKQSDAPLLNYLQAARAAHLQQNDARRDNWLKQAYEQMPEAASAVLLTQAELQLDHGHYEQALATLRQLEETSPNHGHALALLGRLYYRLEDWEQLARLLPRLKKYGRVSPARLREWSIRVQRERLQRAADSEAALAAWAAVPKPLRGETPLLEAWFGTLVRTGQHERAEKEIAAALKRDWRGSLVRIYGDVQSPDASRQLRRAEKWLESHGDDPDLLLTAARLCLRNELWGKARSYLETVLSIRPTPAAYQEYGRLLAQLGEGDAAAEAWRAGLGLVTPLAHTAIPWLGPDPAE
ncbi:MAG TPA: heme biosynthesis HemY N-terminal domain-containing protein [Woeseiaceae bacterium]|nr:heme biosynthesis HemY N-terminal domain-containing protein [Woeseiaceae bacterium]